MTTFQNKIRQYSTLNILLSCFSKIKVVRKIFSFVFILTLTHTSFGHACGLAEATSTPGFCNSFKAIAQCHCTASGLTRGMCSDMNLLYSRMLVIFHTVEQACRYQHDTSVEKCVESWRCYRQGGLTVSNELCNGAGNACP